MNIKRSKLNIKIKISTLAYLLMLFTSCSNDKNISKQEAIETKKLLKNYVDLELHKDTIYVSEVSRSLFAERCLNELIATRPEIDLTSDDIIKKSHTDTLAWTNSSLPYAKILTTKDLLKFKNQGEFDNPKYKDGYYMFSTPIFSRDWRFAIFQVAFICGNRCGKDSTILLENKQGVWHLIGSSCNGVF